jgi:diguanylate cyclase (GGDEF)-like protein
MVEDEYPKEIQIEGPATMEDWELAQQIANDPAEIARALARARLAGQTAANAIDEREKSRFDKKSGLMSDNYYIEEYGKLYARLNSENPRAGDPDGYFQLMLDVRNMHDINNRQGGQVAGDRVIELTGELLRETFRMGDSDIVARTGGDEFSVVTPYYLHVDETGKQLTPDDIKSILMRRLENNWMKLVQEKSADFELLVHVAPVGPGKSMKETRQDADPKNNYDSALVFGDKIEPYSVVKVREEAQNAAPKRQNTFRSIFTPRQ